MILLQRRWHWWRFTLASLAGIAVVLVVTGPEEALRRHIFVPQHFWQYVALHFGFGPPGTRITIGQFLWDLVVTQVWLAVPVGLLAASPVGLERRAGRRRGRVEPLRPPPPAHRPAHPRPQDRPAGRPSPATTSWPPPPSGSPWTATWRSWRQGRYVVPPAQLRGKAMAVVGAPGAGKTVTLLRLAYLAGRAGSQGLLRRLQGHRPHPRRRP